MKIAALGCFFFVCTLCRAADVYPAEADGLRIEVSARLSDSQAYTTPDAHTPGGWRWAGSILLIEVVVRNVSQHSLKIPTVPYFARSWRSIRHWGTNELLATVINPPEFNGALTKFNAERFAPVELAPGEAVLLSQFQEMTEDVEVAKRLHSVVVRFGVSKRFPENLNWWHGVIGVEQQIVRAWTDIPPADPTKR